MVYVYVPHIYLYSDGATLKACRNPFSECIFYTLQENYDYTPSSFSLVTVSFSNKWQNLSTTS